MADQNTLTPDEQAFFATGELPASLATQVTPEPVAPAALVEPTPVVQPTQAENVVELLRQSLYQEQQARAQAEARATQLEQAKQLASQPVAPDANVDPLGAMMHQLNQITNQTTELQNQLAQQKQQQEQMTQLQQFQQSMRQVRDEFVKSTPDFQAAYDHLRSTRVEDMRTVGLNDQQIQQTLGRDELTIAQTALQMGKNPAEVIYNMAKRHGYTPTATPVSAAQKLDTILKGQTAANPTSRAPQSAPEDITLDGLKASSEADLNAIVQDDRAWAKLTGGAVGKDIFN